MPSLQSLCIRDAWGDGIAPMFAAPCIGALKRLAIRDTLNPDEVFAMVKSLHLDQLESLTLEEINLPSSAGRRLGQKVFPRLRHLALRGVNAVPDVKGGLLSGIETLDLSRSVWWEQAQHPLPRLRSLVLTSSRLDADAIASVANATRLPALESLNLRTNRVGDAGLAHLVSGNLPLRELGVSYNGITAAGLRALVKRWPQHLRSLDLSWNPCRDDGVIALTSSLAASELQRLDLSYCELTDRAAEAIAGCSGLGNLQTLNLATNRIGDAGLAALAHSPYLGNLRTLHLGNSAVTNAGVETLVDSPLLDRLEVLMLTGTELDRETRKRLRKTYRGILG